MNFWNQLNCFVLSGVQASDPARFQGLMQTLDFHYQALASGVAEHADKRRVEIEKEKVEKANNAHKSNSSSVTSISIEWIPDIVMSIQVFAFCLSLASWSAGLPFKCDFEVSRKYYKIVCNFPFSQERCCDSRSIKGGCFYYLLLWFVIIIVALFIVGIFFSVLFLLIFLFSGAHKLQFFVLPLFGSYFLV